MNPEGRYCFNPPDRVDPYYVLTLIARQKCVPLHAPRLTGNASTLVALQDQLNAQGDYRCLYVNFELGQAARGATARAIWPPPGQIASRALEVLQDDLLCGNMSEHLRMQGSDGTLGEIRVRWLWIGLVALWFPT